MTTPEGTPLPGPVRQIGFVVRDLDSALAAWVSAGVGPWFVVREHAQTALYRGQPCALVISVALANSGDLQVELIHQHDDTPSIFTEFLDSGREGFHQLAWWPSDFDAAVAAAEAAGWPSSGRRGEDTMTRFAYVEPPAGGPAADLRDHGTHRAHRRDGHLHPRSRDRLGRKRSDPHDRLGHGIASHRVGQHSRHERHHPRCGSPSCVDHVGRIGDHRQGVRPDS